MKRKIKNKGFTLIELMICVAIMGILLTGNIPLFRYLHELYRMSYACSEIARSSKTVMYLLENDIRNASELAQKWDKFSASEKCIILKTPAVIPGGWVSGNFYDYIIYHRDKKRPEILIKRVFTDKRSLRTPTKQELSHNLKSIKFSFYPSDKNAKLVTFITTFSCSYGRKEYKRTFSSSAGLRNRGL
ncbi:MAG: prepilin-type N-terminal cleavage/methylation domain-containing protein [bacterium]